MNRSAKARVDPHRAPVPALAAGVWGWLLFCGVAVLVRGVTWDETLEQAQVLIGRVVYPPGHPLPIYVRSVYSAQTLLSAGFLWATGSALALCAVRNVFFLAATALPPFLLAASLTGRCIWGHAAAVLTLSGVLLEFDGAYPSSAWPNLYSNGHIGQGYALLCVWSLVTGRGRAAALLLGFLPCVHLGQVPPLLLLAGALGVALWRKGELCARAAAWPWALPGLAACVAVYLVQRALTLPIPEAGPYAGTADPLDIWRGYTFLYDPHRRLPDATAYFAPAGALLLGALCVWRERAAWGAAGPVAGLMAYAAGIAAILGGTLALHLALGERLPFVVVGWMPYRLFNLMPVLLLTLSLYALARGGATGRETARGGVLLGVLILFAALRSLFIPLVGPAVYQRYLAQTAPLLFILYGCALGSFAGQGPRAQRGAAAVFGVASVVALAPLHQFGAACTALGLALGLMLSRPNAPRGAGAELTRLVPHAACCVALAGFLAPGLFGPPQHLPASAFHRRVAGYFAQRPEEAVLLMGPPFEHILQARTGQAALADAALPSLVSYVPAIGPSVEKIYRDVYGIGFGWSAAHESGTPSLDGWKEAWASRSVAEWQILGARYGAYYVVAPNEVALTLTPLFNEGNDTLYAIPKTGHAN